MNLQRLGKRAPRAGARMMLAGGLTLACAVPAAALAQEVSGTSDAQVEANVLKALAAASELSTQDIQSSTVYGVVTLTGTVQNEAMRTRAENLVARAPGVKKVVDELALGTPGQVSAAPAGDEQASASPQDANGQASSDGSYGNGQPAQPATPYAGPPPQTPEDGRPNGVYGTPAQPNYPQGSNPQNGYGQQPSGQPGPSPQPGYAQNGPAYGSPQPQGYPQQPPYPQQPQPGYGQPQGAYPQPSYGQVPPPPQGAPYGQSGQGYALQPGYGAPQAYAPQGGQPAGIPVTVPSGALLRVRINRGLDSNHIQPGAQFDGTVLSDVAAGGVIAIPRGASVQGVVVDAKKAGALKGEGELALQINAVSLGGTTYPLQSDLWERQGGDKSVRTVNSALGLGVLGAIVGGVAGGGAGAAIGAGVGAGAGVAGSAASPGGRIIVPPEAVLTFHVAQPAAVRTVSEQEMQRLAYAAGPAQGAQPVVRRRYYAPYYPPAPYPYPYYVR